MRKPIYLIGACALAAAAILVWSQTALVSPGTAAATTQAMSAAELDIFDMQKNSKTLPVAKSHDATFVFSHGD